MFQEYGWTRAGAIASRGNVCGYATQSIRNVFLDKNMLMTEWAMYDQSALTDDLIRSTVTNLKKSTRGK